jgi:hypothetical protein
MVKIIIPVVAVLVVFVITTIIGMYIPYEKTSWYEDSFLVCKEQKAIGLGTSNIKTCFIIENVRNIKK